MHKNSNRQCTVVAVEKLTIFHRKLKTVVDVRFQIDLVPPNTDHLCTDERRRRTNYRL